MPNPVLYYPTSSENVPAAVTAPAASFKKEVSRVMASVMLFFVVYLLLIILAALLAAGCVYGGVWFFTIPASSVCFYRLKRTCKLD